MKNSRMEGSTKYALMVVDSMNIGDAIQAIAARQFLPSVDYYVERDNLGAIDRINLDSSDTLKMIMNGWYIDDGAVFPPPSRPQFSPLLISMHVNDLYANNYTEKAFLKRESKDFFNKFGPVGARDIYSEQFFKKNGMDSYFSGCLTLTLRKEAGLKQRDHILAVNVSDAVYEAIRLRTDRPVIRMDVDVTQNLKNEEMLAIGEYYLAMYQTAHLVITTRLHATLPTLALGGKVLFIEESNAVNKDFEKRFAGLHTLVSHMKASTFVEDTEGKEFSLDNPPSVSDMSHMELREGLIRRCEDYTGYVTEGGFLCGKTLDELIMSTDFISAMTKISGESALFYKTVHGWNVDGVSVNALARSIVKKILNKKTW